MERIYYGLRGDGSKSSEEGVLEEGCWGFDLGCLVSWLASTLMELILTGKALKELVDMISTGQSGASGLGDREEKCGRGTKHIPKYLDAATMHSILHISCGRLKQCKCAFHPITRPNALWSFRPPLLARLFRSHCCYHPAQSPASQSGAAQH